MSQVEAEHFHLQTTPNELVALAPVIEAGSGITVGPVLDFHQFLELGLNLHGLVRFPIVNKAMFR